MDRLPDPVAWLGGCDKGAQYDGDHRDPASRVPPGGYGQGDGDANDNRDSADVLGTQAAQRRAAYCIDKELVADVVEGAESCMDARTRTGPGTLMPTPFTREVRVNGTPASCKLVSSPQGRR